MVGPGNQDQRSYWMQWALLVRSHHFSLHQTFELWYVSHRGSRYFYYSDFYIVRFNEVCCASYVPSSVQGFSINKETIMHG